MTLPLIHLDHLGLFKTSIKGNQNLLGMIDNLTKYDLLYPTRSIDML